MIMQCTIFPHASAAQNCIRTVAIALLTCSRLTRRRRQATLGLFSQASNTAFRSHSCARPDGTLQVHVCERGVADLTRALHARNLAWFLLALLVYKKRREKERERRSDEKGARSPLPSKRGHQRWLKSCFAAARAVHLFLKVNPN